MNISNYEFYEKLYDLKIQLLYWVLVNNHKPTGISWVKLT